MISYCPECDCNRSGDEKKNCKCECHYNEPDPIEIDEWQNSQDP